MKDEERAQRLAQQAPALQEEEAERINALFPAYLFRRARTGEVWATCCRTYGTPQQTEAVFAARHQREARGVDTETAKKERDALQKKLDALREKAPADSREAVEKARREAMAEMSGKVEKAAAARKKAEDERKAAEEALAGIRKELDELRARAEEKKETVPPQTAERLRELEKRLAAADPDVAEFRVRYAAWQEEYQRMMAVLGRLADGAQAEKLRAAVAAALAQMGGAQNGRQHGSENV